MKASKELRALIKAEKDNNEVAAKLWKLLNKRKHNFENGIGYLDIAIGNSSFISYITEDRIERFIFTRKRDYYSWGERKWKTVEYQTNRTFSKNYRNKYAYMASVGKLIRKLGITSDDKEIEKFSNVFNRDFVIKLNNFYFKEVSGKDIAKYYHYRNYANLNGSLGNSCMRNQEDEVFDIYCYNENCSLIVLFNRYDKVIGRALLWKNVKINNSDETISFMDRVYTSNSNHEELFFKYAKDNNYCRKSQQTYGNSSVIFPDNTEKYPTMWLSVCNLDKSSYVPYLDTFQYLTTNLNKISNMSDWLGKTITLSTTDGNAIRNFTDRDRNYSEYYQEYLDEEDSIWSAFLDDYIRVDEYEILHYISNYSERTSYIPSDFDNMMYIDSLDQFWHRNDLVSCSGCDEYFPRTVISDGLCFTCLEKVEEEVES